MQDILANLRSPLEKVILFYTTARYRLNMLRHVDGYMTIMFLVWFHDILSLVPLNLHELYKPCVNVRWSKLKSKHTCSSTVDTDISFIFPEIFQIKVRNCGFSIFLHPATELLRHKPVTSWALRNSILTWVDHKTQNTFYCVEPLLILIHFLV